MTRQRTQSLSIDVDGKHVSAVLMLPPSARWCFVFAHGAGAGMTHPFMERVAQGLASRDIGTLRYQFPYLERGSRRPDVPAVCHATVRAAVTTAAEHASPLPLIAGGKSFGARMTSQAQARVPLPRVEGLAFLGFPLHPVGKPSSARADHLLTIQIPMLFVQGTHDKLAPAESVASLMARLGKNTTLLTAQGADHSFHVPKRSGTTDSVVLETLLDRFVEWIDQLRE